MSRHLFIHSFRIHWALRVGKVPSSGPEIQCVQEKRQDPLLVKQALSGDGLQAHTGHPQSLCYFLRWWVRRSPEVMPVTCMAATPLALAGRPLVCWGHSLG